MTVAQVARAADVSEQTVFNYFATKEDLVYWRLGTFEEELLATIRDRAPGESVLAAFRRFLLAQGGLLGRHDAGAREQLTAFTRMIVSSPALQAREAQILEGYTASLAALIAEETAAPPGDIRPAAAANALMGVHRALIAHTRRGSSPAASSPRSSAASAPRPSTRSTCSRAASATTGAARRSRARRCGVLRRRPTGNGVGMSVQSPIALPQALAALSRALRARRPAARDPRDRRTRARQSATSSSPRSTTTCSRACAAWTRRC